MDEWGVVVVLFGLKSFFENRIGTKEYFVADPRNLGGPLDITRLELRSQTTTYIFSVFNEKKIH